MITSKLPITDTCRRTGLCHLLVLLIAVLTGADGIRLFAALLFMFKVYCSSNVGLGSMDVVGLVPRSHSRSSSASLSPTL